MPRLDEAAVETWAEAREELPRKRGTPTGEATAGVPPSGGSFSAASAAGTVLTIPFEYRGLTEQEAIAYGKKKQQEAIIAAALEALPKRKALRDAPAVLAAVMAEYRKTGKGESVSRLEHHLRRYTGKNTRDYFIHKDLEGFLTRELDFYLKNEVLMLDDLASGGIERAEGWFLLLGAIRAVGAKIIAFLAQIENFQKRIFEKRKFVTETHYCFTLDRVPKALWPRVLKNQAQVAEWQKLYSIQDLPGYSEPLKPAFLEAWPSMMIDTAFFAADPEFVDTLLAAQTNLDDSLGGLLVHSENFQGLQLLMARFSCQCACAYADPPYNTDGSPILYKNSYRNSTWMSLMSDRLALTRRLLNEGGVLCATIDDFEQKELHFLMEHIFGEENMAGTLIIRSNPSGRPIPSGFAVSHEYAVFATCKRDVTLAKLPRTQKQLDRYKEQDERGRYMWELFRKRGSGSRREDRPTMYYPLYASDTCVRVPRMHWDEGARAWITDEEPAAGERILYPVDEKGMHRRWRWRYDAVATDPSQFRVESKADGHDVVYYKYRPTQDSVLPLTVWTDAKYSATEHGTGQLKRLFAEYSVFDFPKSVFAVEDCLRVAGITCDDLCLDPFAGSATTAHAILNLNRADEGDRKYVLVEMGKHFDTVTLPRIQKIVLTSNWEDGKPVPTKKGRASGLSHAFKYLRLESYEDALGNIAFAGPQGDLQFDDYVLRYMLGFETRQSETLLNVAKLAAPFVYRLDIMEGGERKTKPVDLPETFNWLLGLKVSSRQVHVRDGKHRYLVVRGTTNPHGEGGERRVCVIWRDVTGWSAADFKADAEFVKREKLAGDADEVFVNADGVIPGARVLDGVFKERMFAPVAV